MELSAVVERLKLLKYPCEVQIYSDSKYICDTMNKKWIDSWKSKDWTRGKTKAGVKALANKELWIELNDLLQIHKVKTNYLVCY
ncbi:MAG: RNase H family protein [Sarcina sp.]